VGYLEEQRDVVLDALRHAGDLLARKGEWRTTLWTRTAEDATSLRDMLRGPVRKEAARMDGAVIVGIELVEDEDRWGVRVELSFP
jgi:hypothetical protein